MKYKELLEARMGKKDIENSLKKSNLFTYGFEAEFIYYNDEDIDKKPKKYRLEDLNTYNKIKKYLHFSNYQISKIDNDYNFWIDKEKNMNKNFVDFLRFINGKRFIDRYYPNQNNVKIKGYIDNSLIVYNQYDFDDFDDWEHIVKYFKPEIEEKFEIDTVSNTEDYSKYQLTTDTSLEKEKYFNIPIEIVSPVFYNFDTFIENLEHILNKIKNYGLTNNSCGLHINIGFKDERPIDVVKLNLLLGDHYLAKKFNRQNNEFTEHAKEYLNQNLLSFTEIDDNTELNEIIHTILKKTEKDRTINSSKLDEDGFLEFRLIGGKNYEKKLNKIDYTIKRFIYGLLIASDPEFEKQSFMKKIANFIMSHKEEHKEKTLSPKIKNIIDNANLSRYLENKFTDLLLNFDFNNEYTKKIALTLVEQIISKNIKINNNTKKLIFLIIKNYFNSDKNYFLNELSYYVDNPKKSLNM